MGKTTYFGGGLGGGMTAQGPLESMFRRLAGMGLAHEAVTVEFGNEIITRCQNHGDAIADALAGMAEVEDLKRNRAALFACIEAEGHIVRNWMMQCEAMRVALVTVTNVGSGEAQRVALEALRTVDNADPRRRQP